MKRLLISLAALPAAFLLTPTASADEAALTLTVTGIETQTGTLMIALHDEAGYEAGTVIAAQAVPASAESVTTTFDGLAPGQYGIKMFHDVNGDGEMSSNPFGMPTEPFAFSNNAVAQFGPAKWDAAAFEVEAGGTSHTITLQ